MSNEITFIIMKDSYNLCKKLLFWNFGLAVVVVALVYLILWLQDLTGAENILTACLEFPLDVCGLSGMWGFALGVLLILVALVIFFLFLLCIGIITTECLSLYLDPTLGVNKRLLVFDLIAYLCSSIVVSLLCWQCVSFEGGDRDGIAIIILSPVILRLTFLCK